MFPRRAADGRGAPVRARGARHRRCPATAVFDDVERLVRNLIAMNGILRDREHASIRLVMNPDRMVVKEAMRTFTYLNLYGYLTDAVVVNRVFPDGRRASTSPTGATAAGAAGATSGGVRPGAGPARRRTSSDEVVGPEMLDRLGDEMFAGVEPAARAARELTQELTVGNGSATLRLDLPFAEQGDIEAEEDRPGADRRASTARSARWCCRRPWATTVPPVRRCATARST